MSDPILIVAALNGTRSVEECPKLPLKPQDLKHVGSTKGGHGSGQQRLLPRGFHERLRGQVVNLIRPRLAHSAHQRRNIGYVTINKPDMLKNTQPAQPNIIHIPGR